MAMKKCPVCGVSVKIENLERHVRNQHPHDNVNLEGLFTQAERTEVKRARAEARPALTRRGKRTVAIVAVALVAVLAVAMLATLLRPTEPGVGEVAPEFTLSTSSGSSVSLSQFRGRPVILEFMNTLCPACNSEAPILASLYQTYSSRAYFLSVDVALKGDLPLNTASEIEAFKTKYGTPWEYAIDSSGTAQAAYGAYGTPTIFIIDAKGMIAAKPSYNAGEDSLNSLSSLLNRALG